MTADLLPVDEVERRLRAAFHVVIPSLTDVIESDANPDPAPLLTTQRRRSQSRWPSRAAALAVAASLAALAGVTMFQQRQEPAAPSGSALPTTVQVDSPTPTTEATTATTAMEGTSRVPTGWFLPTYVPPGYELIDLIATVGDSAEGQRVPKWLRRGEDGISVDATLSLSAQPDTGEVTVTGTAKVRGQPADVWDPGFGYSVLWHESGTLIYLSSTGLDRDEVLAAAELVIVDATKGFADFPVLPAGFALSEASPPDLYAVDLAFYFSPADNVTAGFISASVAPNNRAETIESLLHTNSRSGRVTVGGIDRVVQAEPADSLGPFTAVTWVDDGTIFYVSGRAPYDEVLAFAEGLAPSTFDAVVAAGEGVTTRSLTMDTLDEVVFDDDVRAVALQHGGEFLGICVTAPVQRCQRLPSTVALGGEPRAGEAATFDIGGHRVMITWHVGEAQPTLRSSPDAATTSAFTQVVTTPDGVFTQIVLDEGETTPTVWFGETGFGVGERLGTVVLDY